MKVQATCEQCPETFWKGAYSRRKTCGKPKCVRDQKAGTKNRKYKHKAQPMSEFDILMRSFLFRGQA